MPSQTIHAASRRSDPSRIGCQDEDAAAGGEEPRSGARALILSAMVGYGHHASALALQEELAQAAPELTVVVRDGLGGGGWSRLYLERLLRRQMLSFPRSYSWSFALLRMPGTRQLAMRLAAQASSRQLSALIAAERPSVIVSTYPAVTAVLGAMRRRGALEVPVCSLITDVAGLHFWAHPGIDLHIACYEESLHEIAAISAGAPARQVSPPVSRAHRHGRARSACLEQLGLAADRPLVVVSGGGWGVGDLDGAVRVALSRAEVQVAVACGNNDRLRRRLQARYAGEERVRVLGFTERMPELLGGASALVHSTGGVTCLEAAVHGCPVIAYGFGHGHLRENLRAMRGSGLLLHAEDRAELRVRLGEALSSERGGCEAPELPSASSQILELV
ncbi:MAG TPA: glycosyltransferase [Solirubrobacteraceae bacterium]|nr:glycosyltransferase [Solirubrobacteraceae bacterium]